MKHVFHWNIMKDVYNKQVEIHGAKNIILVKKSKFFVWTKMWIPFIFWTLILMVVWVFIIRVMSWDSLSVILLIMASLLRLRPVFKLISRYIDYKMDFVLLTPQSLIRYDQIGVFRRVSKTIELNHIRSVAVSRKHIFANIFHNGDLIFLSEGGATYDKGTDRGEIVFKFVYNPDRIRNHVSQFLSKFQH